jgi:hypothetical protein
MRGAQEAGRTTTDKFAHFVKYFSARECDSFLTGRSGSAYLPKADLHLGEWSEGEAEWGRLGTKNLGTCLCR